MGDLISYQRARFATRLPARRRYTMTHCWLQPEPGGIWRVGFTALAAWLLGDAVEFRFSAEPGATVLAGHEIGWVEGLKSVATLYGAVQGEFLGANDALAADITGLTSDPYERGWLYRVRGEPSPDCLDVRSYVALLDQTVDEVIRNRQDECEGDCGG